MNFTETFPELSGLTQELSLLLPRLVLAIAILLGGVIVSSFVRSALKSFFRWIKLEDLAEKSGIDDFLLQGGVRSTTSNLLIEIFFWLFLFCSLLLALYVSGLQFAAEIFKDIILYIPRVLVAVAILIFGSLTSRFIRGLLYSTLNQLGTKEAQWLSFSAYIVMMVFVIFMALEQLQIGGEILVSAFQIMFGSLCLAFAIAFGLGGKDKAAEWINQVSKKRTKE